MSLDNFILPSEAAAPTAADADDLSARAGLYALLARCLEAEVDATLLDLLRGPLAESLDEMGIALGEDVRSADPAVVIAALAEEYAGLFVVPGAVQPFRSTVETGRMFQPQADLAAAAYKQAGFTFHNVLSGEFPDHVAVMLAFVGRLFEREAAALRAGNSAGAAEWCQRRVHFLVYQLGSWSIGWSRRARKCARHPFYTAILELFEQVVWADVAEVADDKTLKRLVSSNRRPLIRQKIDPEFRKASGL